MAEGKEDASEAWLRALSSRTLQVTWGLHWLIDWFIHSSPVFICLVHYYIASTSVLNKYLLGAKVREEMRQWAVLDPVIRTRNLPSLGGQRCPLLNLIWFFQLPWLHLVLDSVILPLFLKLTPPLVTTLCFLLCFPSTPQAIQFNLCIYCPSLTVGVFSSPYLLHICYIRAISLLRSCAPNHFLIQSTDSYRCFSWASLI